MIWRLFDFDRHNLEGRDERRDREGKAARRLGKGIVEPLEDGSLKEKSNG